MKKSKGRYQTRAILTPIRTTILKNFLGVFLVAFIAMFSTLLDTKATFAAPIKIAIVGDSTVADYPAADLHRGWGQIFPSFIYAKSVSLKNFAVNGRSTKTFKSEGRWEKVLDYAPDFVFIQFGHNDSHAKGQAESTNAETDYGDNLREYVDSSLAHHAIPILVTPMHRGLWEKDGKSLTSELLPYAEAMRRVAAEKEVTLIDLYALSGRTFETMGHDSLESVFVDPAADHTHFNEKGARLLARLVAMEATRLVPALNAYLVVS